MAGIAKCHHFRQEPEHDDSPDGVQSMTDSITNWQMDRRVPVALVAALLMQSASVIWWASGLEGRVSSLESEISTALAERAASRAFHIEQRLRLWDRVNEVQVQSNETNVRLSRLEGSLVEISANMNRLVDHVIGGQRNKSEPD